MRARGAPGGSSTWHLAELLLISGCPSAKCERVIEAAGRRIIHGGSSPLVYGDAVYAVFWVANQWPTVEITGAVEWPERIQPFAVYLGVAAARRSRGRQTRLQQMQPGLMAGLPEYGPSTSSADL